VGSLPTGWLIDRFGRRPVMIAGPLLTAGMALMTVVAQSFPELLVYRFLDGWAAQMWLLGRLAAISQRASAGERGRQVNWMYGMDSVGRLAGPLVGGFIADAWGPRSPFAAYAVLALIALIPTVKQDHGASAHQARAKMEDGYRKMSAAEIVQPRLPFFGVGVGWVLFLLGFFLAAIPWYIGAFLLFFVALDHREKSGLIACTIAGIFALVPFTLNGIRMHPFW